MVLIIGGRGQGQGDVALSEAGKMAICVHSLEEALAADSTGEIIFEDFNEDIYQRLKQESDYESLLNRLLDKADRLIIISDEIGLGVVPIDPFERRFREEIGRLQIRLAGKADKVIRVICGISQRLK